VSPDQISYRCFALALSLTSCAAYLAVVPGPGTEPIRIMWMWKAGVATAAMQLATIAAGRAKPPPLGIEDTRARDWLDGLCD
jgi:hypothetical protein